MLLKVEVAARRAGSPGVRSTDGTQHDRSVMSRPIGGGNPTRRVAATRFWSQTEVTQPR